MINDNIDDVWDKAINDNSYYINNKITRIFPIFKDQSLYLKLKIDDESLNFITIREVAELITKISCHHLIKYNLNPQKIKIVDYTAGVGGNTLSFSKYFNHVYAIEISELRANYLLNNIELYKFKNITVINDSALNYQNNLLIEHDINIIFIDPPWGGAEYKNVDLLKLCLDDIPIEEIILDYISKFYIFYKINNYKYNNYNNKFIVIKLPKNYDIIHFYNTIKKQNDNHKKYHINIYLYILNKMLIIVIEINYLLSL